MGCLAIASERVEPLSMSSMTSPSEFLSTPGLHWPSRILRLRRIGRPASCSVESWRVKVVSCLCETLPMVKDFFLRRPPGFLAAAVALLAALLGGPLGDLGDEEALLADQLLGFFLGRGVDGVLDLLAGVVHRLVLEGRHRPSGLLWLVGRSARGRAVGAASRERRRISLRSGSPGATSSTVVRPLVDRLQARLAEGQHAVLAAGLAELVERGLRGRPSRGGCRS